jgi:glutamyl-tRNA synthetase
VTLVSLPDSLRDCFEWGMALRQQGVRGRFAPSPSGALHLGNLRTALLSWLEARRCHGFWLLRLDDLDSPRVRPGAEESILADLHWLGLHWDGPLIRQSERRGLYASVLSALRRSGVLYPCHCSRRLLADISAPHGRLAVYPGHCRNQPSCWGEQQGRWPSWRLKLGGGPIGWQECWGGAGQLDGLRDVGDVVLRRADGVVAYHLATAVDELTLGITDVVRGADLWCATGAQVAVCQALGFPPPRYGHVPVLCDQKGHRLSKRAASEGLAALRAQGMDAPAVIGTLAASAGLVALGSRLSAEELLAEVGSPSALEDRREKSSQSFRIPPPCEWREGRQSV